MFPELIPICQKLYRRRLADVPGAVSRELRGSGLPARIAPGARIAVTVGSRGIANLPAILAAVIAEVRAAGGEPFLLAAMGSHGGATPEGQLALLASLGVTENALGVPVRSSMDVVQLSETAAGVPVYFSRLAGEADGIVLVARVKEHTDYTHPVESGLLKMIAIGLGNHRGAETLHSLGARGLPAAIPEVAGVVLATGRVLLGLALLENGYHETAEVVAIPPDRIEETERGLLRRVKRTAPRLPFRDMDVLIVEEMGKDISGVGLDTKVLGRRRIPGEPEFRRPFIHTVVVLDLSEASHGNAIGVGLADLTTQRLVDKIDRHTMYTNALTSGFLERNKIPVTLPTDREAIAAALTSGISKPPEQVRLVRLQNTGRLDRLWVSPPLLDEVRAHPKLEIVGPPRPLAFDRAGQLLMERE